MTALTADRNTLRSEGDLVSIPVEANTVIYAGALVCVNANGNAVPGSVATTLTYIGRAEVYANNNPGAAGAIEVLVRRLSAFYWNNSGTDPVTETSVGKVCYVVDDNTVSKTNGTNTQSAAGIVLGVDSGGVWVFA